MDVAGGIGGAHNEEAADMDEHWDPHQWGKEVHEEEGGVSWGLVVRVAVGGRTLVAPGWGNSLTVADTDCDTSNSLLH